MTKYMTFHPDVPLYDTAEEAEAQAAKELVHVHGPMVVVRVDGVKTVHGSEVVPQSSEGVDWDLARKERDEHIGQRIRNEVLAQQKQAALVGGLAPSGQFAVPAEYQLRGAEAAPEPQKGVAGGNVAEEAETAASESETPSAGQVDGEGWGVTKADSQEADPLDETGAV